MKFPLMVGAMLCAAHAQAAEQTLQNDSLVDASTAVVVTGFLAGGGAASWLTTPCTGNIRAVQVFWRSQTGIGAQVIHEAVNVYRSGTFPTPGALAASIGGPVLTDGVLNEWRFLDENNVIPLFVPVTQGETVVVAILFDSAPPGPAGPSVVRDTNGIVPQRNAIFSNFGLGFVWRSSESLGVTGDWVIRAVVDCPVVTPEADVAVGMTANPTSYVPGAALSYTLMVHNNGPAAANGTTLVDVFPAALTGVTWTCAPSGGATCTANGSGNITQLVNLPANSQVVYTVNSTVLAGTVGALSNAMTAVLPAGVTDPMPGNNTSTLVLKPLVLPDLLVDGFED